MTATGGASAHGRNITHYSYQDYIELVLREFALPLEGNLYCARQSIQLPYAEKGR